MLKLTGGNDRSGIAVRCTGWVAHIHGPFVGVNVLTFFGRRTLRHYSTAMTVLLGTPSPALLTAITQNSRSVLRVWLDSVYLALDHHADISPRVCGTLAA